MKLYSFSSNKELKREEDNTILAFKNEELEYVAECFEGKYMLELEVNEENIIITDWYLVDTINCYYITNGEVKSIQYIDSKLLESI